MRNDFATLEGVEVFSTGTWHGSRTVTITGDMLDQMVHAFTALQNVVAGFRPPMKLGHSDAQKFIEQEGKGAPALGWVSRLWREGNKIKANFSDVPLAIVDLIRRRLYNSVSIEFLPKVEYEGKTYHTVLSAVALLGAELPAVKGLQELSATLLDDGSERVALSEKEQEMSVTYTQEQHDALVKQAVEAAKVEQKATFEGALAQAKTALETAQKEIEDANKAKDTAEVALASFRDEAAQKDVASVVDQTIVEGRALPTEKDALVAMGQSMKGKVKLASGEKDGLEVFKDMLKARPKIVKLGEKTAANKDGSEDKSAAAEVDRLANEKIKAAGGPSKLAYKDAMQIVLSENEDLKLRYVAQV